MERCNIYFNIFQKNFHFRVQCTYLHHICIPELILKTSLYTAYPYFLQIMIKEEHRDVLRFLFPVDSLNPLSQTSWPFGPALSVYRFGRCFGAANVPVWLIFEDPQGMSLAGSKVIKNPFAHLWNSINEINSLRFYLKLIKKRSQKSPYGRQV